MQHKYGEHWEIIDVETRNIFKCFTPRMMKCVSGINMHGDRTRKIDKCDATAVYPACFENENWDHVIKYGENNNSREEWEKI